MDSMELCIFAFVFSIPGRGDCSHAWLSVTEWDWLMVVKSLFHCHLKKIMCKNSLCSPCLCLLGACECLQQRNGKGESITKGLF